MLGPRLFGDFSHGSGLSLVYRIGTPSGPIDALTLVLSAFFVSNPLIQSTIGGEVL